MHLRSDRQATPVIKAENHTFHLLAVAIPCYLRAIEKRSTFSNATPYEKGKHTPWQMSPISLAQRLDSINRPRVPAYRWYELETQASRNTRLVVVAEVDFLIKGNTHKMRTTIVAN